MTLLHRTWDATAGRPRRTRRRRRHSASGTHRTDRLSLPVLAPVRRRTLGVGTACHSEGRPDRSRRGPVRRRRRRATTPAMGGGDRQPSSRPAGLVGAAASGARRSAVGVTASTNSSDKVRPGRLPAVAGRNAPAPEWPTMVMSSVRVAASSDRDIDESCPSRWWGIGDAGQVRDAHTEAVASHHLGRGGPRGWPDQRTVNEQDRGHHRLTLPPVGTRRYERPVTPDPARRGARSHGYRASRTSAGRWSGREPWSSRPGVDSVARRRSFLLAARQPVAMLSSISRKVFSAASSSRGCANSRARWTIDPTPRRCPTSAMRCASVIVSPVGPVVMSQ